ncbi:50S ribosomal protein L25/general stress protein Ctc [Alcaligenaceae bacterium CGII-47]|nr:50S ribosomal protein L25/general stress protein Ctc [Alcaligenaceae bacterium CGII-47]
MKFIATSRSVQGTSASRRLRRAGRVPAIVYGGTAAAISIELDHNEIYHALNKEAFHASILDMILDGGQAQPVLLRSAQWHPYKAQVLHVDFQRVDASQAVNTKVPVHYLNADISPAVKLAGQTIIHGPSDLDITCLPASLPKFIDVDLANMIGDAKLHLSDITLPKGVKYVPRGEDVNPLMAAATPLRKNVEADDAATDTPAAPAAPAAE